MRSCRFLARQQRWPVYVASVLDLPVLRAITRRRTPSVSTTHRSCPGAHWGLFFVVMLLSMPPPCELLIEAILQAQQEPDLLADLQRDVARSKDSTSTCTRGQKPPCRPRTAFSSMRSQSAASAIGWPSAVIQNTAEGMYLRRGRHDH